MLRSANPGPEAPVERRLGVMRAVAVFAVGLALGIGGLYLVAGGEVFRLETYRVRDPSALVVALCVLAFVAEWFLMDVTRIWLLCRKGGIPLPFRSAILVLVLDMVYFAWSVPLSLGYLIYSDTLRLPPGPEFASFAIAALAIVGAVFLTRYPRPVVRLILAVARLPVLGRFAPRLRGMARDYYRSAIAFRNMALSTWLALNLVVATGWFSGFVLFWLLLNLYGVEADLLATLAILSSVTLVAHLFPTPGGSGFMEAALGLSIGAGGGAAAALLIWRLASYHAIFLLGPPAVWLLYLSKPVTDI